MDLFTRRRKAPIVPEDVSVGPIPGQGRSSPPHSAGNYRSGQNPMSRSVDGGSLAHQFPTRPAIGDLALQARVLELEERVTRMQEKFEERVVNLETSLTKSIESKWERFEQYDRRFKEYIRGEQEVNQSQLVNLKSSGMEYILEKGETEKKLVTDLELKMTNLDTRLGQCAILVEKLIRGDIGGGGGGLFGNFGGSDLDGEIVFPGSNSGIGGSDDPYGGSTLPAIGSGNNDFKLISSRLVRAPNAGSTLQNADTATRFVNNLVSPRKGALLMNQGAQVLNYNVALDHLTRQLKFEQEARQVLQEEVTQNFKSLQDAMRDFMHSNEKEFLKDQRQKLQEEHDNRIIKISEGAVNDAVSRLKLALDLVDNKHDGQCEGLMSKQHDSEQKMLENISLAAEQAGKNSKDLWEAHINMGSQWKEAVANLQTIIDHRNSITAAEASQKLKISEEVRDKGFLDQKKVNDAFDGRLAKAELVVLEQGQKLHARYTRLEEEEKRWEREFSSLSVVLNHMKTKLGVVGKSQAALEENCIKKIQEECERITGTCLKVTEQQYDKFQNISDKQKQFMDSVDKLNKENRRLCVADIANNEKKLQASMTELTASCTRMLQQSDFENRSVLAQKLEEEKEFVIKEIKAMESNNIEFRMQLHAKLDATESALLDRIATVDKKCYAALQAEKKYILEFEKKTNEYIKKFQHTVENRQTKHEIETNAKLNDQQVMLAKDIADVWRKLEAEVKYMEKSCDEMMNAIKKHETKTEATIEETKKFWNEKFKRELDALDQNLRQTLMTEIEKERADRIKSEAERLKAMQKRFEAFEDVCDKRFDEQTNKMENYMATTNSRLETHMQENSNLLEKKFGQLKKEIEDFHHDYDQNNIRLEEKRIDDLEKISQWKNEVEARQLAHNYAYEKTMRVFLNVNLESNQDEIEKIRRDAKATSTALYRAIDKEKMERIKSQGEQRALLEQHMDKNVKRLTEKMEDSDTKWDKKTTAIVDDQDLENQRMKTETSRVESEANRKLQNREDVMTKEFDEKLLSATVSAQAALDGVAEEFTKRLDANDEKEKERLQEEKEEKERELERYEAYQKEQEEKVQNLDDKIEEMRVGIDERLEKEKEENDNENEKLQKDIEENNTKLQAELEELSKTLNEKLENLDTDISNVEGRVPPEKLIDDIIERLSKVPTNAGDAIKELDGKLDANVKSLVAQQEARKFLQASTDAAADGMSNKFLQTILADTENLKNRVGLLEKIGLGGGGGNNDDDDDEDDRRREDDKRRDRRDDDDDDDRGKKDTTPKSTPRKGKRDDDDEEEAEDKKGGDADKDDDDDRRKDDDDDDRGKDDDDEDED